MPTERLGVMPEHPFDGIPCTLVMAGIVSQHLLVLLLRHLLFSICGKTGQGRRERTQRISRKVLGNIGHGNELAVAGIDFDLNRVGINAMHGT